MAQFTVRRDGSSNFGPNNKWGTFPSVSLGWNVTNEKFLEKRPEWFTKMKVRLSWGKNGNEAIGSFRYTANVAMGNNYTFGGAGNQLVNGGSKPSGTPNADLKWEESEQYDAGLDLSFFNNSLTFTVDWFKKKTNGMLKTMSVPSYLGESKPWGNVGDMENSGIEFELGYKFRKGDWAFNVNANASYLKNKLVNLGNDTGYETSDNVHQIGNVSRAENGQPYPFFYGYKTAGIFQNQKEINEWVAAGNGVLQGSSVKPGDVKYYDVNHDGTINDADKVNLGNGMPDFTYGFSLGFGYKGLDFSVTANGSVGNDIVQSYRNVGAKTANYTSAILQRWTGEGTSNKYPRVTETNVNYQFSDLFIQDGDFLRISNITLGYDFAKLLHQKFVSQARLYFQVQNAFTFTKYDGMDPEIGYGVNSWASGVDLGYYPRPRTFMVGLNLKF